MADQLTGLSPEDVLRYFEIIAAIPHGSGNEKELSDYLVSFATERNLEIIQDESWNVIIRKPASKGAENKSILSLQGHIDMVCEKVPSSTHNFEREGLELLVEDGFLSAKGTTLGADDGVAVACMLAILADDTLAHPPLECIFTVSEEIGLLGAANLSPVQIQGKTLINLDSEEEGVATVSSAGGARIELSRSIRRHENRGFLVSISMEGLLGGHSGMEIQLDHVNATLLMARTLHKLLEVDPYAQLVEFCGGTLDNAIPRECEASVLYHTSTSADVAMGILEELHQDYHREIRPTEPGFKFHFNCQEDKDVQAMAKEDGRALVHAVLLTPNGVVKQRVGEPSYVIASTNLGVVSTTASECRYVCLPRSSVASVQESTLDRIRLAAETFGFTYQEISSYPGWAFAEHSPIRDVFLASYAKLFREDMKVETIHAGLETGLFVDAVPGLDAISVGPTLLDVHTPQERMELASLERFYTLLIDVLESLSK